MTMSSAAIPTPAPAQAAVPPAVLLASAQASLLEAAERLAATLRDLTRTDMAIPGSAWTVREATAHVVSWAPAYADMAAGGVSPLTSFDRDHIAAENARRLADVRASEPAELADLVLDGAHAVVAGTDLPAEHPVTMHAGAQGDVRALVGFALGEMLLHGYDVAGAVGAPWPILPADVAHVLYGYAPTFPGVVDPETTAGLTVAYDVDLGRAGRFGVSFTDGALAVTDPAVTGADCRIEACPRAFLLVATGRLNVWTAVTLGLWRGAGDRPGLAPRFPRLFRTV